jgi:UDP-2-acetamido-3-amino-2,3-dideoxy-glucuronate N-acetyltransferase
MRTVFIVLLLSIHGFSRGNLRILDPVISVPQSLDQIEVVTLPQVVDERGKLVHAETGQFLPFCAERIFVIYDVPSADIRGQHAHRELVEFLVALRGCVTVKIDDGVSTRKFHLDGPQKALVIPPFFWRELSEYSHDALVLVAASTRYDPSDYIRDYEEFLSEVRKETPN